MPSIAASKPLLTALRGARSGSATKSIASDRTTRALILLFACLMVLGVCAYLHRLEPVANIKSVELTHADIALVALVVVAFLSSLLRGFVPLPKKLMKALFLFFLATLVSAVLAIDLLRASAAVLQIVEFGLLAWAVSLLDRKEDIVAVIYFVLGVMVVQSVLAAFQFAVGEVPSGIFLTNQKYAMFTGFASAMAFGLLIGEKRAALRVGYVVVLFTLLMGCILGQERAPWIAFIATACVTIYYSGKNRFRLFVGFCVTIILAVSFVLAIPDLRDRTVKRITSVESQKVGENTLLSRLALWAVALKLFSENPVFGVGPKNFVTLVPSYLTFEEQGGADALDPHNVWVGILAEQGVIGFATYVYFLAAIVGLAIPALKGQVDDELRPLYLALLAYQVFWIVMSLHYFTKGEGHIHFLMLGLLVGLNRYRSRTAAKPAPQLST